MSKLLLFMAVLLLIFSGLPLFAAEGEELELGISLVPIGAVNKDKSEEYGMEPAPDPNNEFYDEPSFMDEWLIGFHVAYNWGIIYASLDSMALPPFMIKEMTRFEGTDYEGNPYFFEGHDRPGFINFLDAGIKLSIGDIVAFGTIGFNSIYIYRQAELPEEQKPGTVGTNLRIGAGYKIAKDISIGLTGTAIFPNFKTMSMALKGLVDDKYAYMAESIQFVPMFMAVLYM